MKTVKVKKTTKDLLTPMLAKVNTEKELQEVLDILDAAGFGWLDKSKAHECKLQRIYREQNKFSMDMGDLFVNRQWTKSDRTYSGFEAQLKEVFKPYTKDSRIEQLVYEQFAVNFDQFSNPVKFHERVAEFKRKGYEIIEAYDEDSTRRDGFINYVNVRDHFKFKCAFKCTTLCTLFELVTGKTINLSYMGAKPAAMYDYTIGYGITSGGLLYFTDVKFNELIAPVVRKVLIEKHGKTIAYKTNI